MVIDRGLTSYSAFFIQRLILLTILYTKINDKTQFTDVPV